MATNFSIFIRIQERLTGFNSIGQDRFVSLNCNLPRQSPLRPLNLAAIRNDYFYLTLAVSLGETNRQSRAKFLILLSRMMSDRRE